MKKLLILLFSILISFNSYGEEVSSGSYDWKKWDCYDFIDSGYILSIGYIPEIGDSKGILFVKESLRSAALHHSSLRSLLRLALRLPMVP